VTHKTQLWLAACDIIATSFFLWQVIAENINGSLSTQVDVDPGSSLRLTVAFTLRATCFAIVILLTVAQVRRGQSVSLGRFQVFLWAPMIFAMTCATILAGALANAQVRSLFFGLTVYSVVVSTLSTVAFGVLIKTLNNIRRNLGVLSQQAVENRPRPSFATEDVDALKEGSSWVTSTAGSRRESMSQWSFSTWHTPLASSDGSIRDPKLASSSSLAPKSSFWFNKMSSNEQIPPVPPLPTTYRHSEDTIAVTPATPTEEEKQKEKAMHPFRHPKSSNDSWLTSPSVSQESMSAFSFPTTRPATPVHSNDGHQDKFDEPRFITEKVPSILPAVNPKILGGYAYDGMVEKGVSAGSSSFRSRRETDVALNKIILWTISIWIPCVSFLPSGSIMY
jgi:hypothetical protein